MNKRVPSVPVAWAMAMAMSLAALTSARSSRADDSSNGADAKHRADALFTEGKMLMSAARYGEACPKFAASVALDPGVGAMLWQGECEERADHPVPAWRSFAAAERTAAERFDAREAVARDRKTKLDPRVARVAIDATNATNVIVLLDGREDASFAAGMATEVAIEPGAHSLRLERSDGAKWSASFALHAGERIALRPVFAVDGFAPDGPLAVASPMAGAAIDPAHAAVATPTDAATSSNGGGNATWRSVGIGGAAAGLVAIGAGLYLGQEAKTGYDGAASDGHCNAANQCDPEGIRDRAHAASLARDATLFVASGVGVTAVGTFVAIKWWNVRVAPTAGRSSLGIDAIGTF